MELSLAVNASLVALSKFGKFSTEFSNEVPSTYFHPAIFCTEPFRIPFAGRVDVCCFDKTGTITAENLVLEGVTGVTYVLTISFPHLDVSKIPYSEEDSKKLVNVKEASRDTILCLAAAHALVRLDDGTVVGDPMEKTTLDALEWTLVKGDVVTPSANSPHKVTLTIRRRFQFSSALKRMSTISTLPGGKLLAAVKGAPETIKTMLDVVPSYYDETYKGYTRQGSRVLALGIKEMGALSSDKVPHVQSYTITD